jgi:thioredoxin reductase
MTQLPRAAVIGAGSSGIAAIKTLHQRRFDVTGFEKSDRVGGNWVYRNSNGMSSAYRSLHINTSRERMEYADFPMPKSYPDFPHHTHIARYFDDYVEHFGFRDRIRFRTGVDKADRSPDGTWELSLDDGTSERFDALFVANGHHWDARWPEPAFPGSDAFEGLQLHSHEYTGADPNFFRDKSVVVLGMGNSAMDIAVEASFSARHVYLAARRGAHVIPKYLFGRPLDQYAASAHIPFKVRRNVYKAMLKVAIGDMERYGLPKPDHEFGSTHPTISDDILSRIAHGEITPKPNIAELAARTVRFSDGSLIDADVVVYCTGYRVTFPFFDSGLISAPDNDLPLFRRVFHPALDNVFFVGLLQPLGAIMPLAEAQGAWVGDYLLGDYALPSPEAVRADIAADQRAMRERYVASKRHTIQVDYDDYLHDLACERAEGLRRARANGFARPIPCRRSAATTAS